MTSRERFLATMLGGTPDRIPYNFGHARQSTMEAWYRQGLPRDADLNQWLNVDHWEGFPAHFGPCPAYEPVVLEEGPRYKIWIDELGAKRIDHKRLPTPGFVTRTWLEFPVKTREDFRKMVAERYDPHTPERAPSGWEEYVQRSRDRSYVIGFNFPSMFWRVRDWVGFEGLCMLCAEDPSFVHEMMEFVVDFTIAVLEPRLGQVDVDFVFINEDMAYKTASMISPAMVREFMMPGYHKLARFFKEKGVNQLVMDCDGHIGELIPLWLEAGIDVVSPVEIAAYNDPVEYKRKYGKHLGMWGGIDKRELRYDKERVKREVLSKVPWLIEQGRFIPQVDHGVPPDVPVRNYLYLCELVQHIACGGNPDTFEPELEQRLGPIEEMWTPDKAWTLPEDEEGT